jgi:hypothetical protein
VRTQLVGLVYDKDSQPGDQVTVSITTDPKKYQNIPALAVVEMKIDAAVGGTGTTSLHGVVVDLGDGRKQPADQPLTVKISEQTVALPVTLSLQGTTTPVAEGRVPIGRAASLMAVPNTGQASDFSTYPVVQNTSIIHGPLSGDGNAMHIAVDNQPATIVAATPRSVVFDLPPETTSGEHTLTLQDGNRTASAQIVKVDIQMHAGQLRLLRGQSTNYTATVKLQSLPDSVWQRGGSSPDLVNPLETNRLAPDLHIPQTGEPGAVLLRIENDSPGTITIRPSQNGVVTRLLHQQDFKDGQFTEAGVIQSERTGSFVINGTVVPFFAPVTFNELGPRGDECKCVKLEFKKSDKAKAGAVSSLMNDKGKDAPADPIKGSYQYTLKVPFMATITCETETGEKTHKCSAPLSVKLKDSYWRRSDMELFAPLDDSVTLEAEDVWDRTCRGDCNGVPASTYFNVVYKASLPGSTQFPITVGPVLVDLTGDCNGQIAQKRFLLEGEKLQGPKPPQDKIPPPKTVCPCDLIEFSKLKESDVKAKISGGNKNLYHVEITINLQDTFSCQNPEDVSWLCWATAKARVKSSKWKGSGVPGHPDIPDGVEVKNQTLNHNPSGPKLLCLDVCDGKLKKDKQTLVYRVDLTGTMQFTGDITIEVLGQDCAKNGGLTISLKTVNFDHVGDARSLKVTNVIVTPK